MYLDNFELFMLIVILIKNFISTELNLSSDKIDKYFYSNIKIKIFLFKKL